MKTKPCLNLEDCKKIGAACEAEARKNKWNVVIAILDEQIANAGIAALGPGN